MHLATVLLHLGQLLRSDMQGFVSSASASATLALEEREVRLLLPAMLQHVDGLTHQP
jgi:hypothetical protein